jgi:hypothetical protein
MRFRTPKYGDQRTRSFFAWCPVSMWLGKGQVETRWLERVWVLEEYREGDGPHWWRVCFIDSTVGKVVDHDK